jgi:aminoglycoside/choline kinase family phosphotransferase
MIAAGYHLAAYPAHNHYWRDMGTPESFFEAAYESTTPQVFERVFGSPGGQILRIPLSGDGSDRRWFRLASPVGSLILADHGIHSAPETGEADAFVRIGRHLRKKGVPVPEIHHADCFSGLVYLEDLGDTHLQSLVLKEPDASRTKDLYRQAIDALLTMHHEGAKDFEPAWTCQTPAYDRDLILGKECRYFVEAFLIHYLNLPVDWEDLREECEALADLALAHAVSGLLHRDCQSRNIMAKDGRLFFIDFQGARSGPLQYDLASLLTDPYVGLSPETEEGLLTYCIQRLKEKRPVDPESFRVGYRYCCLTRIMQSLGAFGFLTKVKNKPFFARFIPVALTNINRRLRQPGIHPFPLLADAAKTALMAWEAAFGPSPASTPPLK